MPRSDSDTGSTVQVPIEGFPTLQALFDHAAGLFAGNCYIRHSDGRSHQSYRRFAQSVDRILPCLCGKGLKPGDRIALCTETRIEALWIFWSAVRLGLVVVPIDAKLGNDSMGDILMHCDPRMLFVDQTIYSALGREMTRGCQVVIFGDAHHGAKGAVPWAEWLKAAPSTAIPRQEAVQPQDDAVILYTSGSTGTPKGVVLSHGSLGHSAALMARTYRWSHVDLFFNLGELHTMSGLRNTCLTPLCSGSAIFLCAAEARTSIFEITGLIAEWGCTLLGCGPFLLRQLQLFEDRISWSELGTLRAILCTGSALDQKLAAWILSRSGIPVFDYYGLTETAGLCAGHLPDKPSETMQGIGRALGARLEIVDDAGRVLPTGAVGELTVSSPGLMSGYYKQPEMTRRVLRGDKFHTGDLARCHEDGNIVLVGRKTNFIKNAHTEIVYFEEVERALERHPMVAEAGVCGYSSALGDERLAAFVVLVETAPDTESALKVLKKYLARALGVRKAPAVIQTLAKLPRNSAGKLLRKELERRIL